MQEPVKDREGTYVDPCALGDGDVLEVEVLSEGLAQEENARWVQAHGLLQACLQVGQLRQVSRRKCVHTKGMQLLYVQEHCSAS